ncbi:hypothetical protein ACFWUQ_19190 [Streptomyces sp. NPDC058662]|uniref:hypothetical protein n=1 Tax=Streptomyces sp. NPDC058662 TaxID=3346583 RepID=UPI0036490D5F
MARTAHHSPQSPGRNAHDGPPGRPWRSVELRDLRYSARELAEATRGSRRPRPRLVRRAVDVYAYPRLRHDRSVSFCASVEERRARQRLRRRLGVLVGLVNGPAGGLDLDAADAVDVAPARHRRGALWLA